MNQMSGDHTGIRCQDITHKYQMSGMTCMNQMSGHHTQVSDVRHDMHGSDVRYDMHGSDVRRSHTSIRCQA